MSMNTTFKVIGGGLLLLAAHTCIAQSTLPRQTHDSLWALWNDAGRHDTIRVEAMLFLAQKGYLYSQPDSARHFARAAHALAERGSSGRQMANALNLEGISFDVQGDYPQALASYERSLTLREQLGLMGDVARSHSNIGIVYRDLGNPDKALEHYARSVEIKEALGDEKGVAITQDNMALIYRDQGDHARAIQLLAEGLKVKERFGDARGMANSLTNLGNVHYLQGDLRQALDHQRESVVLRRSIGDMSGVAENLVNMGSIRADMGDADSAYIDLQEASRMFQEIGDRRGTSRATHNLAQWYFSKGEYDRALASYTHSLTIRDEIGDGLGRFHSLSGIGQVHAARGDHAAAIHALRQALDAATAVDNAHGIMQVTGLLHISYKAAGDHRKALEAHELHITMRDSIHNAENQRAVMQQKMQHAYDKKEALQAAEAQKKEAVAQEELRRRKAERNAVAFGFLSVILIGGGTARIVYDRRKAAFLYRSARAELKALQAQMRPHFIFNALNSVNNFLLRNEPDAASTYLIRFSKLMRTMLHGTIAEQVTLREELAVWENYLELERPNFRHGLNYQVVVATDVDADRTLIPPLLVQPLLENALWHGIYPKLAPGHVEVSVSIGSGLLVISVTDDGVGRSSTHTSQDRHPGQDSVGISLTRERIALLDGGGGKDTGLYLTDLPTGLRAELRLPLRTGV